MASSNPIKAYDNKVVSNGSTVKISNMSVVAVDSSKNQQQGQSKGRTEDELCAASVLAGVLSIENVKKSEDSEEAKKTNEEEGDTLDLDQGEGTFNSESNGNSPSSTNSTSSCTSKENRSRKSSNSGDDYDEFDEDNDEDDDQDDGKIFGYFLISVVKAKKFELIFK